MSSSKQPSETTTTVKNELPAWAQPYSEGLMAKGAAVAERPYQAYTGNRIAGFSPEQLQGMQGTMTRATQGNAAVNAGQGMLEGTLRGDYLSPDSNPWFRQNVENAMGQVQGRLNNQFNNPGAFGSTAHQEVMNRGLGELASGMYGQNYANERANQMNAAGQALGYGAQDYNDLNAMLRVGDTAHMVKTLTGISGTGTLTTNDFGMDGAKTLVRRVRPRYVRIPDSATLTNYYRDQLGADVTEDVTTTEENGKFDYLRAARWHRGKLTFTGNVELTALDVEAKAAGRE